MLPMKLISWYLLVSLQISLHHLIALAKYLHLQSPAGCFDTPYGVCGGWGAPDLQVVAGAGGIGSRLEH